MDESTQDVIILLLALGAITLATVDLWRTDGRRILTWAVWLLALVPVVRRL